MQRYIFVLADSSGRVLDDQQLIAGKVANAMQPKKPTKGLSNVGAAAAGAVAKIKANAPSLASQLVPETSAENEIDVGAVALKVAGGAIGVSGPLIGGAVGTVIGGPVGTAVGTAIGGGLTAIFT
jgi:hypothetical protein